MKKFIGAVLVSASLAVGASGTATAGTFTLNPSVVPGCGACTSPVGDVFGMAFIGTSFVQYFGAANGLAPLGLNAGDTFNDFGALRGTELLSAPSTSIDPGDSGLNVNWRFGAIFNALSGANTSVTLDEVEFGFTPFAGSIDLYAEPNTGATNPNDPASIADGTLVGTLEIVFGDGDFDFDAGDGRVNIVGQFTSVLAGFWENFGIPINLGTQFFFAITDSNNNLVNPPPPGAVANFDAFFPGITGVPSNSTPTQFFVSNDGSVQFQVPEPGTLALLGAALLGLGTFRRRNATAS